MLVRVLVSSFLFCLSFPLTTLAAKPSSTALVQERQFANGDVYKGPLLNDQPHGKGEYGFANGDEYRGQFQNGRFQGEGEYRYSNGDTYRGHWDKGIASGQGEMHYQNGNRYVGEWQNNQRHGKGQLFYRSGSYYKGNWANGRKDGKGFMQYRNGERYVGDYVGNKPHGHGVQVESTGDVYRGTFSRGLRHGVGECNREGGEIRICLFDRGNEITDPVKLQLAKTYLEKNRPVFEFQGGIAYQMEDQFTKARYQVSSQQVWWEKTNALLADQLRIRSEDEDQFIFLVVNRYTGPGVYHLKKGEIMASSRDGNPIELTDDAVARVEIRSDRNGEVSGVFAISGMKDDSARARSYRLYDGQFQARATPPEPRAGDSKSDQLLVKSQQEKIVAPE